MDAKLKDLWLTALRSGEYAQTRMTLKDRYGYCCLGLLCHVAAANDALPTGVSIDEEDYRLVYTAGGPEDDGYSDEQELNDEAFGLSRDLILDAMGRNDGTGADDGRPQTFAQIADWLETAVSTDPALPLAKDVGRG